MQITSATLIKPDNCGFVVDDNGKRVYVIGDFGCASASPDEIPENRSLLGTIRTRAPETIQLPSTISLKYDVWALGTTIAAVALERYPFMSLGEPMWQADERLEKGGAN